MYIILYDDFSITNKIRKTPRITSTITMIVIEEQGGKEEKEE